MGFFEATKAAFTNALDFSGRASRPEFWWFMLASMTTIPLGLALVTIALSVLFPPLVILLLVPAFWLFIASLSLTIRRLRDAGGSVWWYAGYVASYFAFVGTLAASGTMSAFALPDPNRPMTDAEMQAFLQQAHAGDVLLPLAFLGLSAICGIVVLVYLFLPTRD